MREYGDSANVATARGRSIQGGMFGLVLAYLSMLSIRFGSIEFSLTMIPLIAIFLWPRGSSRGLSSVFIFSIGLLVDILSAGPPGMWAFIYLVFYGALQPDQRSGQPSVKVLWSQFLAWVAIAFVMVLVLGQIFVNGRTAVGVFLAQAIIASALFPIFYGIRQGLRQLVSDPDDPGYSR